MHYAGIILDIMLLSALLGEHDAGVMGIFSA